MESESGYYEYDVTFQGDEFEDFRFAYGTISLGQSTVAVYIVYDEGNVESFVLSDGGKLEIDAYGEATFRDEAGNARGAAAVREADDVVEGRELMRVRVLNEDGRGYGEEKSMPYPSTDSKNRCCFSTRAEEFTTCSTATKFLPRRYLCWTVWATRRCSRTEEKPQR